MKSLYGNDIHVITVYVIDPHPNASRSPYQRAWPWDGGNVTGWKEWWEYPTSIITDLGDEGPWSNHPLFQPRTFKERVHQARSLVQHYGLTDHPITTPVLIDEMDNPFWCTYGYLPNCAYFIGQDGTIVRRESWFAPGFDLAPMKSAIEAYLQ